MILYWLLLFGSNTVLFLFWKEEGYIAANWLQDENKQTHEQTRFFGWFKKRNIWPHSALLNQWIGADPSVCHTFYNILLSLLSYVSLLNIIET